jgi:hypothetical protein
MESLLKGTEFIFKCLKIIKAIRSTSAARRKSIFDLVDRKFVEIELTHLLFLDLLTQLRDAAAPAQTGTGGTLLADRLAENIANIEKQRDVFREERRRQYEEAAVYGSDNLNFRTLGTVMPQELSEGLVNFMLKYVNYFRHGDEYRHRLGGTLRLANELVDKIRSEELPPKQKRRDKSEENVRGCLHMIIIHAEEAQRQMRDQWADVSSAYYSFVRNAREYGLL